MTTLPKCAWPGCPETADPRWYLHDGRMACDGHGCAGTDHGCGKCWHGTPGRNWNVTRGCSRISPGCQHCYAERIAERFCDGPHYEDVPYGQVVVQGQPFHTFAERGKGWTRKVALLPEMLAEPLRWRKPSRVFVCSTSDLFHEALSDEDIAAVFGVMAAAPQHTFQVLTKRAERMRAWFAWRAASVRSALGAETPETRACVHAAFRGAFKDASTSAIGLLRDTHQPWPLPNVWLGVSVEDQQRADERIPHLLATPAAVRWVSYEPALGPVDFTRAARCIVCGSAESPLDQHRCGDVVRQLDWIVVGGESGPGARPFDLAWARSTIRQCREAGVPAFFKQTGDYVVGDTLIVQDKRSGTPMHLGARRWIFDDASEWVPPILGEHASERPTNAVAYRPLTRGGKDPQWWPEDLRVREFPEVPRAR